MITQIRPFPFEYAEATNQIHKHLTLPIRDKEDFKLNLESLAEQLEKLNLRRADSLVRKYLEFLIVPPRREIAYSNKIFQQFLEARIKAIELLALTDTSMDICARPQAYSVKGALEDMSGDEFMTYWGKLPFEVDICIIASQNPLKSEENEGLMWKHITYF